MLKIPEKHFNAFESYLRLSKSEKSHLLSAIMEIPVEGEEEKITNLLIDKIDLPRFKIFEIVRMIFELIAVYFEIGSEIDEFFIDLKKGLAETKEIKSPIDDYSIDILKEIFSKESIFISFKASSLEYDRSKLIQNFRILSDIRPIFSDKSSQELKILGEIVIHSLKIVYFEDSNLKSVFFALDKSDLLEFKEQIDRALNKKDVIAKSNINDIPLINT